MKKHEQLRQIKSRKRIIEHVVNVSQNISQTCRYFGISRKTYYKWKERHEKYGDAGLCDRSKKPHRCPHETRQEVVSKILYIRQNYHFGAQRISYYLKRYHEISIASSSVQRILQKHQMGCLPSNQRYKRHKHRWKRYEKRQPGHRIQVDVKFLERIAGTKKRLYQYTAIDDCTRIRILKIYDSCNQKTSIRFINEVINRLPFRVLTIQTDNGAEFQTNFQCHLLDQGINHVHIKPHSPHLNGKVERSHRIDEQEFYQLLDKEGIRDDIHLYNKKLKDWEDYYNYNRPHGALNGQTPYERLKQKSGLEV